MTVFKQPFAQEVLTSCRLKVKSDLPIGIMVPEGQVYSFRDYLGQRFGTGRRNLAGMKGNYIIEGRPVYAVGGLNTFSRR